MDNVSTWRLIFIFSPKLSARHNDFIPEGLLHLCHIKKLGIVSRSRCRSRRRCSSSLLLWGGGGGEAANIA